MIVYTIFFVAQFIAVAFVRFRHAAFKRPLVIVLAAASAAFAGLRGDVGTDTFVYRTYYESVGASEPAFDFGPGFFAISVIGNWLGFGSQFLLLVVAAIQCMLVLAIASMISEPDIFYLLVLSRFYVPLDLNIIRNGLSAHLGALAIALFIQRCWAKTTVLSVMAVSVHASAIVLLIVFFPLLTGASAIITQLALNGLTHSDQFLLALGAPALNWPGIGATTIYALFALCLSIERLWRAPVVTICFALSIACAVAGPSSLIFERSGIYFEFGLFIALLTRTLKSHQTRVILAVVSLVYAYRSVAFVTDSDAAMEELFAREPGMKQLYEQTLWIPYRFFWQH
jgi:hypothetical protein